MNREVVCCGVPFDTKDEAQALKNLKDLGFTSVQIYVHWNMIEPEKKGEFDFGYYDRQVKAIQAAGLKWVPFIQIGPRRSMPDWWLADEHHVGMTCLEHGVRGGIESVWNPAFRAEITRVLEAIAEHYLPWNVIESIQPGISGDYGEAIYPGIGNWPGMYHTHYGYWCMDECATEDFRRALKEKYGDIKSLNSAWRSVYGDFSEILPFKRHKAPSRTALFDFLMWYKSSMTEYDEFWMRECQRIFGGLPVYMCTGGDEESFLGADFAEQARASAKYGGGIRLTNEGNGFDRNYADTVHCATACEYYGAYMGLEPVGGMMAKGVTARIFGSAAYGNRQIFHYYGNLYDDGGEGAKRVQKYGHLIGEREKKPSVALFHPLDMAWLGGDKISENVKYALNSVRRKYEAAIINETLIEDGVLDTIKVLIMLGAKFTRASVLEKIAEWVKRGGVLITDERTTDIEGDYVKAFDDMLGFTKDSIYCGGIAYVAPSPLEWNKDFTAKDDCYTKVSWSGLADDIRPMISTVPSQSGGNGFTEITLLCCGFEHKYGEGRAVYYCGQLDLRPRVDSMFKTALAFSHILSDVLREFAGEEELGTLDDEIARSRVDGRILVLKTDEIFFDDERPDKN